MRICNTWLGDAARMEITKATLNAIKEENLIQQTVETGDALLSGLEEMQVGIFMRHLDDCVLDIGLVHSP